MQTTVMPLCVDVVTGETVLRRRDLRLPGYIPLTLARRYRSGRDYSGPFGHGWRLNWELTLEVTSEKITYAPDTPHEVDLSSIEEGTQVRHGTGMLVQHGPESYALQPSPSRTLVFEKDAAWEDALPLSRIEDPSGNTVHFFYDRERIAGIVDSVGRQIRFKYQGGQVALLKVIGDNDAASTIRTFQYSRQGDLVEETDAEGHSATFGYRQHLMTEYTRRGGGTQYAGYTDGGRCKALRYGDESEVRRFAYDDSRPSTLITQGDGRQTLYWHVDPGRVLERVDPSGGSRNYFYNDMHRLIGFSDEQDVVQVLQQEDTFLEAGERVAFFELDKDRRITTVLDGLDNQYRLGYRAHRLNKLQASSSTWTFGRDGRGSVTEVASPSGRSVHLRRAAEERKLIIEGEEGLRIEDHFDERGRLIERTDSLQRRFRWRYDGNDRLKSVSAGGQSLEFDYGPRGRPTRIVDAQGQISTMMYDPFGKLKEFTTGDQQYQLTYDSNGQVTGLQGPGKRQARVEYEKEGQVAKVRHATGTLTYRRTEDGLKSVSEQSGQRTEAVYNPVGDPVRWDQPGEPEHLLEYGPSGELMVVERGDRVLGFSYDENGRVVKAAENGQVLELEYDIDGGLVSVSIRGSSKLGITRDERGRPVEIKRGSEASRLSFDAGDRLCAIEADDQKRAIHYDVFNHPTDIGAQTPSTGETLSSPSNDVQTHNLSIHGLSSERREEGNLQLHTSRHGVALSLRIGSWCLPLWRQKDYLSSTRLPSSSLIAATLAFGEEPLLAQIEPHFAPHLPKRWTRAVRYGIRTDYTEIPRPSELSCFGCSPLSYFFLTRRFYEMSDPSLLPSDETDLEQERGRSTDPLVAGSHVTSALRPPIWTHRAVGQHFHREVLGPPEREIGAIDLLEFICQGNHTMT